MFNSGQTIFVAGLETGESFESVAMRLAQTLRACGSGVGAGACPELKAMTPYGGAAVAMPFAMRAIGEFRALAAICHAHGFRVVARIDAGNSDEAERERTADIARGASADDVRFVGAEHSSHLDCAA